jgi:hypothetical protein
MCGSDLAAIDNNKGTLMKVLIVGGDGREHALAWKCAQFL